ncbi:MAG TPA: NADH-quinone oxidoreductase subunit I [Candidatus Acetothermia bacterium]|nr:NADH-quinone oxidoreductase subunit I [Candidatus Acetothermia bacterium]
MILPVLGKYFAGKRMTLAFPKESEPPAERYRGRHVFYIDKCISCGTCERVCPNKAIIMLPHQDKEKYPKTYPQIDLAKCCFCALCQEFCPTNAIELTTDYFLTTFDRKELLVKPTEGSGEETPQTTQSP